jgi:hypothetical protein
MSALRIGWRNESHKRANAKIDKHNLKQNAARTSLQTHKRAS